MWILEEIPIGMHVEDYDHWGSQAGRVFCQIDQIKVFRRQMEHCLCNRYAYIVAGPTISILLFPLVCRLKTS